jgi:hypothetical protein
MKSDRVLAIVGLISLSPKSFEAQSIDDSKGQGVVTLDSLVDGACQNPEPGLTLQAALTRPYQDSALPDPRITAGLNNNGNPFRSGLGEPTSNIGMQMYRVALPG